MAGEGLDVALESFLEGNVDPRGYNKARQACINNGIWSMEILKKLFDRSDGTPVFVVGTALTIADALKRKLACFEGI